MLTILITSLLITIFVSHTLCSSEVLLLWELVAVVLWECAIEYVFLFESEKQGAELLEIFVFFTLALSFWFLRCKLH